jgi:hypothetical protein
MAAGVLGISRTMLSSPYLTPTALALGLCVSVGGGALIYFAASRALGSGELGDLLAHATRRVRSR